MTAPRKPPPPPEPIAEFLRTHALHLPEPYRVFLALQAGPELAEGSMVAQCVQEGRLPENALALLRAALVLQWAGGPPEVWEGLRDILWVGFKRLKGGWDGLGAPLATEDPDIEAFRAVGRRFEEFAEYSRRALQEVEEAGYRWNWEALRLETLPSPGGGRPRSLLRDMVAVLLETRLRARLGAENTPEVREALALELAPFISPALLETRKGSPLYSAVDHALRQ